MSKQRPLSSINWKDKIVFKNICDCSGSIKAVAGIVDRDNPGDTIAEYIIDQQIILVSSSGHI